MQDNHVYFGVVIQCQKEHHQQEHTFNVIYEDISNQYIHHTTTSYGSIIQVYFPLEKDNVFQDVYIRSYQPFRKGDRFVCTFDQSFVTFLSDPCVENMDQPSTDHISLARYYSYSIDMKIIDDYRSFVTSLNYQERNIEDCTQLQTFTMDPEESRDFDDAISFQIVLDEITKERKYKIYVHIVDYHSYVPVGSDRDIRAFLLNQTLYLPGHSPYYMLPVNMACDTLSLLKGKNRKTWTIEFTVNDNMTIESHRVYPATIIVKERLDYSTSWLQQHPAYQWVKKFVEQHKTESFHFPLPVYEIDQGEIVPSSFSVYKEEKGSNQEYNKQVISTLMILANETISKELEKTMIRSERAHELPFTQTHSSSSNPLLDDMQRIKTYKKAYYSSTDHGHYGLRKTNYTHFTSPARRSFDSLIHRMLWTDRYLDEERKELLSRLIEYCNQRQTLNKSIQQYMKRMHLYRYICSQPKDKTWNATVVVSKHQGITVYLDDSTIESRIHRSALEKEKTYHVGDRIVVCHPVCDVAYSTITFSVVS